MAPPSSWRPSRSRACPQQLSVRNVQPADSQRKVTYTATAPVARIDADYRELLDGVLQRNATVAARDVPVGMTLEQTSARAATFAATSPLGSVEVGYGEGGEPVMLDVDHPYARVIQGEEGDPFSSYAGRLDELMSASVDATDGVVAELQLGPDGRKPLRTLVDIADLHIDGLVSDLPRHLTLNYAPGDGRIEYDAFGETIGRIDLDAEQAAPFFGRVTEIHGTVEDLPSQATVDIKPNNGGMRLETNNPIGRAEALLTSGPDATLPDGIYGAAIEDVPSHFTAFARVQGLRLVDVTRGPGRRVAGHVKLASTPLVLQYRKLDATDDLDVDASLSAIPDEVSIDLNPEDGTLDYDASAGIETIDATVESGTAFFGRVKRIVGHVEDLPASLGVVFKRPDGADGFRFATTEKIGDATVLLTSGPGASLPAGEYGADVVDIPARFTAVARVKGLRYLDVATASDGRILAEARLDRTPMVVRYELDDPVENRALELDAELSDIPSQVRVGFNPFAGTIAYDANGPLDTLDATVTSPDAFFGRVKRIVAHVEDLPASVDVDMKRPGGTGFRLATTEPVGDATVLLSSGPDATLPAGEYGAAIVDIPARFTAVARVTGLRLLDVLREPSGRITAETRLDRTPLVVRYELDDPDANRELELDAALSAIPAHTMVRFDPVAGTVDYQGDQGIDTIDATITSPDPFFGRVTRIVGHVEDLPADVSVAFKKPAGQNGLRFFASESIGDATVLLSSGPDAEMPEGEFGAAVTDLPDRFTAVARVQHLKLLDVTSGPGRKLDARLQIGRQPLALHYNSEPVQIDAALSEIPSDVALAFDPDEGKLDYTANEGIASIEATVDGDDPLFGEVEHIEARVLRLPQQVSIGFKPASGSGGSFNATPAVGMIEAKLTDGFATIGGFGEGEAGLRLKSMPGQFAVSGKLYEVSGATVTADGDDVDATLETGELPGAFGRQDLLLHFTLDVAGDAITNAASIHGFVEDLPGSLHLRQHGAETTYEASAPVPLVTLNASHLPGEELEGSLHEVRARLVDVPAAFKIVRNATLNQTGVEAEAPFTRIDLDAWDTGDQRAPLAEDGRNKVLLDTRGDNLYVQTRVFGLQKVVLTNFISTKVETAFGVDPAPLDVDVLAGDFVEPVDLDVVVDDLPRSSTFEVNDANGLELGWDASEAGTDVDVKLSSKDVGADLQVPNLPDHLEMCVGSGIAACGPRSPLVVRVDPGVGSSITDVLLPNTLALVSEASDLVRLNGKVCLRRTNILGEAYEGESGDVYGQCLPGGTSPNQVTIDNLRLKTVRMEFAAGDTLSVDDDDDPIEDDLLKLYIDSDATGISVDKLRVDNKDTEDLVEVVVHDSNPLRNATVGSPFFRLWDLTIPPSEEDDTPFTGRLNCLGTVIYMNLPFFEFEGIPLPLLEVPAGEFCADVDHG